MDLTDILTPIQPGMRAVDTLIRQRLGSDVVLINQLSAHIINSGGKRLRPALVLIAAAACEYQGDDQHLAAAIIEFIHTATLLHDDVVDDSGLRRGQETANAKWGNAASVLTGDFLYSRAFQMMVDMDNMRVMEILANTTNAIAEGEVLQLLAAGDPDTTEDRYLEVIDRKTARLFGAGARLGAIISRREDEFGEALQTYGWELGMAFQLIDDALDYRPDAAQLGKNVGDDLAEGKVTLPLIHAMSQGTPEQRSAIRHAISQGHLDELDAVLAAIESTGAIHYTAARARERAEAAQSALQAIPDTEFRTMLHNIAGYVVERDF